MVQISNELNEAFEADERQIKAFVNAFYPK